jgi:hypothetical protein
MEVKTHVLLSLSHLIHFGLSFNELNKKLDKLQKSHFEFAGKNVLDVRDPFTVYVDVKITQERLWSLCGVDSVASAIDRLNDDDFESVAVGIEREWLIATMSEAVTRYKERCSFYMIEHDYHTSLIAALGDTGFQKYLAEADSLLGKSMVCGSADQSEGVVKEALCEYGEPYSKPPYPYMQMHDKRFAETVRQIQATMRQYMS